MGLIIDRKEVIDRGKNEGEIKPRANQANLPVKRFALNTTSRTTIGLGTGRFFSRYSQRKQS
jgi:hypothetical protein